jgi:hypothetical protein
MWHLTPLLVGPWSKVSDGLAAGFLHTSTTVVAGVPLQLLIAAEKTL